MAELQVVGGDLVLRLSVAEKIGGVHGDFRVPLSALRSIEVVEDAHGPADGGIKLGTRIPDSIEVGTVWSNGRKTFAVVHPGTPRGLWVVLEGSSYDEWIVGCADPETVAQAIMARLTRRMPPP